MLTDYKTRQHNRDVICSELISKLQLNQVGPDLVPLLTDLAKSIMEKPKDVDTDTEDTDENTEDPTVCRKMMGEVGKRGLKDQGWARRRQR